jgi:hypothetical protein
MTDLPHQLALQIGELSIRGGLITADHLEDAVRLSEKMNVPLPRVLAMNGYMTEQAVNAALVLRKRVDENQMPLESAIKALVAVAQKGVELETAIRQLNPSMPKRSGEKITHTLAELMAAAGVVSPEQLNQGLYNSLNTGLPLGMVLVAMDLVSPLVLEWCLTGQRMVREGTLKQDEVVQALRAARLRGTTFQQSLVDHRFSTSGLQRGFGIGELLVLASVITETQLLAAREIELQDEKSIDQVLLECGMASSLIIGASQQLLSMIKQGILFEDQAATIVRKLRRASSPEEIDRILNNLQLEVESQEAPIDLIDLLKAAGVVSQAEIETATQLALQQRVPLLKTLLDAHIVSEQIVQIAHQCKSFLDTHALDLEQARIALSYSIENDTPLIDTLNHFGWNRTFVTA